MATKTTKTKKETKKENIKEEAGLLGSPRITEKASMHMEQNVYTFNIGKSINKGEIKKAIFAKYKVQPLKINVLNFPRKATMFKGQKGMRGGGKKALVYLKKGDKIEIA